MSAEQPFAFTTQIAGSLRTLLAQRSLALLGCNQKSKTVQSLSDLEKKLIQLVTHLKLMNIAAAIDAFDAMKSQGFASAARVLAGADAGILPANVFVAQAARALATLKQALAHELGFYTELVSDPALAQQLAQWSERLN